MSRHLPVYVQKHNVVMFCASLYSRSHISMCFAVQPKPIVSVCGFRRTWAWCNIKQVDRCGKTTSTSKYTSAVASHVSHDSNFLRSVYPRRSAKDVTSASCQCLHMNSKQMWLHKVWHYLLWQVWHYLLRCNNTTPRSVKRASWDLMKLPVNHLGE